MARHGTVVIGFLAGMALVSVARGVAPDSQANPYEVIVVRNAFGLMPPPPPPVAPTTNAPPPQVELVGVARVFGVKKALLKIGEGNKPVDLARDLTVVLEEGAREKDVEVLQIDEVASTVKVNVRGVEATLVFNKEKLKLASAPAAPTPGIVMIPPAGFPGIPAPPAMPVPTPVSMPGPNPFSAPQTASAAAGGAASSLGNIPARQVRTAEPIPSIEVQTVVMEVERERTRDAVAAGILPPLPPTPLTPDESTTQPPANTGGTTALPPGLDPRFPRH